MELPTQKRDDDCLRACMAGLLDWPIDALPDPPFNEGPEAFWNGWHDGLERRGYTIHYHNGRIDPITGWSTTPDLPTEGRWIAVVPSFMGRTHTHAVLMEGKRIFHDPGGERKRVRKVWFGVTVEPVEIVEQVL